jgi:hypothetical protein
MPAPAVTIVDSSRIEYTTTMATEVCCSCGVPFAMPASLQRNARQDPDQWFWCPNGHRQHYTGETEEDRLRRKLTAANRRADSAESTATRQRQRAEAAERSRSAYKAVATRQRNRIARGVCPCCNRYFPEMNEHMFTQHPDYAGEPLVPPEYAP